jgi:hypothetical protein
LLSSFDCSSGASVAGPLSVESILSRDFSAHGSEELLALPATMAAEQWVELADGKKVQVPLWLRGCHPMSAQPRAQESLVDFSVPTDFNMFHQNMKAVMCLSDMSKAFSAIDSSNIFVLGSSGNVLCQ